MPEMSGIFKSYKIKGTNILNIYLTKHKISPTPQHQSSFSIFQDNIYTQHVYLCELL